MGTLSTSIGGHIVDASVWILVIVVLVALFFECVNGFHDAANAIATSVRTEALTLRQALLLAAFFNIAGAFIGTAVAKTIGDGLIDKSKVSNLLVLAALMSAIVWNLLTWWWGLPSSSSHALIGGLIGAAVAVGGWDAVMMKGVKKVFITLVTSPLAGFLIGFVLIMIIRCIVGKRYLTSEPPVNVAPDAPEVPLHESRQTAKGNVWFRRLQVFSASGMALSHGSNDAQKTMGVITMALIAYYNARDGVSGSTDGKFAIEAWVIILCAFVMGIGTWVGGKRIIHTMGNLNDLTPAKGFAAETGAGIAILGASWFGAPVSTTHVIGTTIMGVGVHGVCRYIASKMLSAWILTIPICAVLAAIFFRCMQFLVEL